MSFSRQLQCLVDRFFLVVLAILMLGVPVLPGQLGAAGLEVSGEVCAMACSLDGGTCCCVAPSRSRQRFEPTPAADGGLVRGQHAEHLPAHHGASSHQDDGHSGHQGHSGDHSSHGASEPTELGGLGARHAHLWAIDLDLSAPQPCPGVASASGTEAPASARPGGAHLLIDTGAGRHGGVRAERVFETCLDLAVLPRPPPVLA